MSAGFSRKLHSRPSSSGISVQLLSGVLMLAAFVALAFSLIELRETVRHTQLLYELEEERQACDKAIQQLMDGSDYLTTQVQQFVVQQDRVYMDNYWQEIHETRSRDKALEIILAIDITPQERRAAQGSKYESDLLMNGEIWAMRVVSECMGIPVEEMPPEVAALTLKPGESALPSRQKQSLAIDYVFGPSYSAAKDLIRGNVTNFRNEIANRYGAEAIAALNKTKKTSSSIALEVIVFILLIIAALFSFTRQVARPLVSFSHALRQYEQGQAITLREKGAREIRQFAAAFNRLYSQVEQNTKRLERLSYYDYLTSVPNRASVTEYVEEAIAAGRHPLGLLIVDIDDFKRFNDVYGHALGDKVLQQVALAICSVLPEAAGISGRICGEEFLVVAERGDEASLAGVAETILERVRRISWQDVDLTSAVDFHITVSVGGMLWQGEPEASFVWLLSRADKALYQSKQQGKDRYTFWSSK